ncbi:MAG: alpha/beta hydrolase, partial [Anaerolineae bacterium]
MTLLDTIQGTFHRHAEFPSALVEPRNVDVWLPPPYSRNADRRFPVIYMHDGQNLFDPRLAFTGMDWGMDEAITRLTEAGDIGGAIVVGIWNREDGRWPEYMPQKALSSPGALEAFRQLVGSEPLSDRYLRFLVQEIKSFVDETYRTLPGRESTFVMGSSMGALISLYA